MVLITALLTFWLGFTLLRIIEQIEKPLPSPAKIGILAVEAIAALVLIVLVQFGSWV